MAESADTVAYALGELAQKFGLGLQGDAQLRIAGVCSLEPGKPGHLSFCTDPRRFKELARTLAAAVVIGVRDAAKFSGDALLAPDPGLAFAKVAALFDFSKQFSPGVHETAVVAPGASIGAGCWIGPYAVIEEGVSIGDGSFIGPHCLVRQGATLGPGSRLEARVYIGARCRLGARALVHPGAVIGGRGFGLAPSPAGWVEVPQLGIVSIGDDVEIGANTTIDRGALDDTVIEDGVKLDNIIQIAHNCRIGAHTAIAACVGIAGSTVIGKRCMIGGATVINGHIRIADDVVTLGKAMITKSLTEPGVYGSGTPALPARDWRRQVAHIRRLPALEQRLEQIEKKLMLQPKSGEANEPDNF
jgi:UDP-3-O-[3-hydroxymyristoyl] glucosamine N-acyltransferase